MQESRDWPALADTVVVNNVELDIDITIVLLKDEEYDTRKKYIENIWA
jgi:hypothetical protein